MNRHRPAQRAVNAHHQAQAQAHLAFEEYVAAQAGNDTSVARAKSAAQSAAVSASQATHEANVAGRRVGRDPAERVWCDVAAAAASAANAYAVAARAVAAAARAWEAAVTAAAAAVEAERAANGWLVAAVAVDAAVAATSENIDVPRCRAAAIAVQASLPPNQVIADAVGAARAAASTVPLDREAVARAARGVARAAVDQLGVFLADDKAVAISAAILAATTDPIAPNACRDAAQAVVDLMPGDHEAQEALDEANEAANADPPDGPRAARAAVQAARVAAVVIRDTTANSAELQREIAAGRASVAAQSLDEGQGVAVLNVVDQAALKTGERVVSNLRSGSLWEERRARRKLAIANAAIDLGRKATSRK